MRQLRFEVIAAFYVDYIRIHNVNLGESARIPWYEIVH